MRISRVRACVFLVTRMIHRRGFSTLVLFINVGSPVVKGLYIKCVNEYVPVLLVINLTHSNKRDSISTFDTPNIF